MTHADTASFRDVLRAIPTRPSEMPVLSAAEAPAEPLGLLRTWLEEEADRGTPVAHAFTLATVSAEGAPEGRTVILKDLDGEALWFASSARSRKGVAISESPVAEAVFYWAETGRQVRVSGPVAPGPREVSDADFMGRHPNARAGVVVGRQGTERPDPDEAGSLLDEALAHVEDDPDDVPGHWIAYRLEARSVDVVQLRPASDGERIRYERGDDGWTVVDLWP
jgi:pyridoxamine 5'-phosphate oxidase